MATRATHQIAATVGANIVAARERLDLTQQDLAHALSTSISRVSSWENGHNMPRNPQAVADLLFEGDIHALYSLPAEAAA